MPRRWATTIASAAASSRRCASCRSTWAGFASAPSDHRIGGVLVRRGEVVLAMTESAMFDSRQVKRRRSFDPTRPASHLMHFGFGMHWCLGFMIARAQITQTFKALLPLHPERASPTTYWGGFPEHLHVTFGKR